MLALRRLAAAGLLIVWACLVALTAHLATNTLLRAWAALDGCLPGFRLQLLLTWKTFAALFLAVACALLVRALVRRLARPGVEGRRGAMALAGATLVGLGLLATSYIVLPASWVGRNRWGFSRVFPASTSISFRGMTGEVALLDIETNEDSYRDESWLLPAPEDGVERVILVGDSTVFGHSITSKADQLDTLLEKRLSAAGAKRWEVWNVAAAPSSLRYFTEVVKRAAPDASARYAILFVHCSHDVYFLDEQLAMADKPAWFYPVARATSVWEDILQVAANPWPRVKGREPYSKIRRALASTFEGLVAYASAKELHVVVWEAAGPCELFDAFRDSPHVTFRDHRHTSLQPRISLYEDPALGYPMTGHLTPRGMAVVADTLSAALLGAERRRREAESTPP